MLLNEEEEDAIFNNRDNIMSIDEQISFITQQRPVNLFRPSNTLPPAIPKAASVTVNDLPSSPVDRFIDELLITIDRRMEKERSADLQQYPHLIPAVVKDTEVLDKAIFDKNYHRLLTDNKFTPTTVMRLLNRFMFFRTDVVHGKYYVQFADPEFTDLLDFRPLKKDDLESIFANYRVPSVWSEALEIAMEPIENYSDLKDVMKELVNYRKEHLELYGSESSKPKGKISLFKLWEKSKTRREVGTIIFDPDVPPGLQRQEGYHTKTFYKYFNRWKGIYCHQPNSLQPSDLITKKATMIVDHFREIMCNNDPAAFKFVWSWLCHVTFNPGEQTRVVLYFCGEEGSGKSIGMTAFAFMLGNNKAAYILQRSHHLNSKFFGSNGDNCIFLLVDELHKLDKEDMEYIKSLITCKERHRECKGDQAKQVRNFLNLAMCGNIEDAIPLDARSAGRRFFIQSANSEKVKDKSYFDDFAEYFINSKTNDEGLFVFHRLLLHSYESGQFKYNECDKPETEQSIHSRETHMQPFQKWWSEALIKKIHGGRTNNGDNVTGNAGYGEGHPPFWYKGANLHVLHDAFLHHDKTKSNMGLAEFRTKLKEVMPENTVSDGDFTMPTYNECRSAWEKVYKIPIQNVVSTPVANRRKRSASCLNNNGR